MNLVMLIFLLASCSSTRFIYILAEEFILNEITFFLNLNKEEEAILSQEVSKMVAWHRSIMLPSYAAFLKDMADKLEDDQYNDRDIINVLTNGRSLIEDTLTGLTPRASKFLVGYSTIDTIDFMEKKMLIRQQDRLKELLQPQDILYEERLERLTTNFKRFLGFLSNDQVALLEVHARVTLGDSLIRLNNRTQRQKVFVEFLRTQPTEKALTAYLNKLMLRGHTIINPTHKVFVENSLDRFQVLIVSILEISSIDQRETIINKLRDYADDFLDIS